VKELLATPLFGIMISLLAFEIGCFIYNKTQISILNPLLIAITLVIVFLLKFNINLEDYNKGAQLISFFLGPATIVLAVPLYKKINLLKANALPILTGITLGSISGIISVVTLSKILKLDKSLAASLVPKSITTPIGIEVSKQLGGIPAITVAAIIITGIIGAIIAPYVCKVLKIKNKIAVGIAIGTSSHALGTTKAVELGETEGAMSSLSIGIAGIIIVFLSPILIKIINLLY
jgi:predicted murein hydrolase (TIGR00659 family)